MLFMYVDFMTKLMAPRPYPPQPNFDPPRLTPLRKVIADSTLGVLTSCGAQLKTTRRSKRSSVEELRH